MHSIWRAVTVGIVVTLAVVVGVNVTHLSAQASDPRVGTWKLNVAKSKYNPGPAPQSQTLKVEASGKGEKITSEVVSADAEETDGLGHSRALRILRYMVSTSAGGGPSLP